MNISKYKILTLICCIILISCCKFSGNNENIATLYRFRIFTNHYKEPSDTIKIEKRVEKIDNKIIEFYGEPDQDSLIIFAIEPNENNDKTLMVFTQECKFLEKKLFKYNNTEIEIYKYDYDVPNSEDEESYIYYNRDFGLIAWYNTPWLNLQYIEYQKTIGLKEKFFADSTGFLNK